jgi:N-ethylmaleimide reductase
MAEYYAQRASDGGLIITEATSISLSGSGWLGAPGLYSGEQIAGWKKVLSGVHAKGGRMFAQLWHTVSIVGGWAQPSPHRAFAVQEFPALIADYRRAAERAMEAGFEGVELHAANGYLIDQFLQDGSNKRTDGYGGSIENRARLLLEVVDALISVCGTNRVAVRIGPNGTFNGMSDSDPQALFSYVAQKLNPPGLAYLHLIEPRVKGSETVLGFQGPIVTEHLRTIFKGKMIAAGGFEPGTAEAIVKRGTADAVAFGRHFVSNPDLPRRIREGFPLSPYDRSTFYTFDARGYTDYPAYDSARSIQRESAA